MGRRWELLVEGFLFLYFFPFVLFFFFFSFVLFFFLF